MANSALRLVPPSNEKRAVHPVRRTNAEYRTREHLTEKEVERLIEAAKTNRYGHRDATMILIAFRHGLRASELCRLRWSQVELGKGAALHVTRLKNGKPATHPLSGREQRALGRLRRDANNSDFVFVSERGSPFAVRGFQTMVERAGRAAGFEFKIHPHMLRHSCGFKLAGDGHDTRSIQDYLGHRSIQHTVRYTELSPERFKCFWKD